MSSWAKPGVKCVCVNDSPVYLWGAVPFKKGDILTVAFVEDDGCLGLVEWPRGSGPCASYDDARFRPLITKTQEDDVAMFRGLLTGAPVGVDA